MAGSKMSSAASLADRKVVSVSTNLGTKIVLVATLGDSFGTMRATIESHHTEIFPQWGQVSITAVEAELWNGRHHIHDDFGVTVLFLVTNPSLYVEMTSPVANILSKAPMLNPADAIGPHLVPELELVKAPASPGTHTGPGERLSFEGEAAVPGNLEVGFALNSTDVKTCDGGTSGRCGNLRSDAVDRHARKKKKKFEEQPNGVVDGGTSKKKKHRVEEGVDVRGEDEASNVRKMNVEEQANRAVEVETSKKKKKKHKVEERVDGAGEAEISHKKQKVEEPVNGATEVETSTKKHKVKKQLNGAGEGETFKKKEHKAGKRMDTAGQVEIANPDAAKEAVEVVEKQSDIGGTPAVSEERPEEHVVGIAKPSIKAETVGLHKRSSVSARPNGKSQTGNQIIEKVRDGPDVVGLQLIEHSTGAKSSQAGEEGHGAATSDDFESRQPLGLPVVDTVDRHSNLETSADRVQLKSLQSVKAWHESSSSDGPRSRSLSVPEKIGNESDMLNALDSHPKSSLGVGTSGKSKSTNSFGSRGQSVHPVAEMPDIRPLMVTLMTDVGGRGSLALDHVHASSSTDNCGSSSESGSPTNHMKKRGGQQATGVVLSVVQDGKNLQASSLHNPEVLSRRDSKRHDRRLSSGTTTDGSTGDSVQSEDFGKKSPLKLQSKNDVRKEGDSSPEDVSKSHKPGKTSGEKDAKRKITTGGSAVSSEESASDESASDDRTSASEAISDDTELHNRVTSRKMDGDGDGVVRSNIRRSSGEFVHRKYQHLIDSQDGFDELISLSLQKLKVGPASLHDLHPVDEVRNSEELVSLADDNLATDLVPDNEGDAGHQDLVEHIISQDKVEANMKIASKSAVQNELDVVEPLKTRKENGKDGNDLPGSAKDGDFDRLLSVKPEPIVGNASIPTGKEGTETRSDDSQQLRAAVQLARMSMSEGGSQKPPEKSPIRKNKPKKQERSILKDHVPKGMDAVLDVAPVDLGPQDSQLNDTEKHSKSSVKDLSIDDRNLDTNCLSSPNLVVDISPEHVGVTQAIDLLYSKQDGATTEKNHVLEETAVDAPVVKRASTEKKISKQSPFENESHDAVGIIKTRGLAMQASGDAALCCVVNDEVSNEDSGKEASFEYRDLRKLANSESIKSSEKQKLGRKGAKGKQPLKAVERNDVAVESPEMAKALSKSVISSHPESSSPRMLDLENGIEEHTFRFIRTILPDSQGYDFEFSQKNMSDSQGYDIQCGQREPGSPQHILQVSQMCMPSQTPDGQVGSKGVKDRAGEGEKRRSRRVSKLIAERESSLQGTEVGSVVPNAVSGEVSEKDSGDRVLEVTSPLVSGEVRELLILQGNNNMVSKERDAKKRRRKALQALVKSTEEAQKGAEVQQNLKVNDPSLADQTLLQGQRTGEEDNVSEPEDCEDEEVGPINPNPIQNEQTLPRMRGQVSSGKKKKRDGQIALSKVLKAQQTERRGDKAVKCGGELTSKYEQLLLESTKDAAFLSIEQMPTASTEGTETQPLSLSAKSKLKMKKPHSDLNTVVEQAKLDAVEEVKELEIPGDAGGDKHKSLTTESVVQNENFLFMGEEWIPSATRQGAEAEPESVIEKIKLKMKRRHSKVDTPLEQTKLDVVEKKQQLDVPKQTAEEKHPVIGLTSVLEAPNEATDKKKPRKRNLSLSAVSGDSKRQGSEVQTAEITGHGARQTEQEDQEATAPCSPVKVAETIVKHSNLKKRAKKSANDKKEDGTTHDGEDDDTFDGDLETTLQRSNLKKRAKKSANDKKEDGTKHDGEDDDTFDNELETTMHKSNRKKRAKKSVKDKKEDGHKHDGEDDDTFDNEPEATVQQNNLKRRAKKSVKNKEEDGPKQNGEEDDTFDNEPETTARHSNLKKRSKSSVKDIKQDGGSKHDGEDDYTFDSEPETTMKHSNLKKRAKKSVKDKKEDGPKHAKDDDTFVIEPVKSRKSKQGPTKEVTTKSDASAGLQQVDGISRVACPHGCGKQYSSKTSAYYLHVKKCDMALV